MISQSRSAGNLLWLLRRNEEFDLAALKLLLKLFRDFKLVFAYCLAKSHMRLKCKRVFTPQFFRNHSVFLA